MRRREVFVSGGRAKWGRPETTTIPWAMRLLVRQRVLGQERKGEWQQKRARRSDCKLVGGGTGPRMDGVGGVQSNCSRAELKDLVRCRRGRVEKTGVWVGGGGTGIGAMMSQDGVCRRELGNAAGTVAAVLLCCRMRIIIIIIIIQGEKFRRIRHAQ